MSRWHALMAALALGSLPVTSLADDCKIDLSSEASTQACLEKLAREAQVATAKKNIAIIDEAAAGLRKTEAASRKSAAQDLYEAAQKELTRVVPAIKVKEGSLTVVRPDGPSCDALPYLRWQCNNEFKCNFTVGEAICGVPGTSSDPMVLSFSYWCGPELIDASFKWGKPAYATCN